MGCRIRVKNRWCRLESEESRGKDYELRMNDGVEALFKVAMLFT